MESWIVYGVLASLCWGSSIVAVKVATSEKYFGINPSYVSLFMLIGIAIGFLCFTIYSWQKGNFKFSLQDSKGNFLAIIAGVLWSIGMLSSLLALFYGADVSKLTPLYNTNTLVAVLLGIILLHELPSAHEAVRVITGAILIVIGAILVTF